jgi:tetratricopeptide (TPR) repeat protein
MLLGEEQGEPMFESIKNMSFVSRSAIVGSGWTYHDKVRELILCHRYQESRHRWRAVHSQLASYYAEERDKFGVELKDGLHDEKWQGLDLEWLYHTVCAQGRSATDIWVSRLLDGYKHEAPDIYHQSIGEVLQETGQILKEESIITWGQKIVKGWTGLKSVKTYEDALPMLDMIIRAAQSLTIEHQSLALRWRGLLYYKNGNGKIALEDFTRAIELQPEVGDNFRERGWTYRALGASNRAIADFTHAIELQAQDYDSYRRRAWTYRELGNLEGALEDFTRAIELQPDNGPSYYGRGRVNYVLGNHTAGVSDFTHAIELQPEIDRHYFGRGVNYFTLGDYAGALADFNRAIELEPKNSRNYILRGVVLLAIGDYTTALKELDDSSKLDCDELHSVLIPFWQGVACYLLKRMEDAQRDWEYATLASQSTTKPCIQQFGLARLTLIAGHADQARDHCIQMLDLACNLVFDQIEHDSIHLPKQRRFRSAISKHNTIFLPK